MTIHSIQVAFLHLTQKSRKFWQQNFEKRTKEKSISKIQKGTVIYRTPAVIAPPRLVRLRLQEYRNLD